MGLEVAEMGGMQEQPGGPGQALPLDSVLPIITEKNILLYLWPTIHIFKLCNNFLV